MAYHKDTEQRDAVSMEGQMALNRWFFFWVSPLMRRGFGRPLSEWDALSLPMSRRPAVLQQRFAEAWAHELKRRTPLLAQASKDQPSVLKVLFILFRWDLSCVMGFQTIACLCKLGAALLVRTLTAILAGGNIDGDTRIHGIVLAVSLWVLSSVEGICAMQAQMRSQLTTLSLYNTFACTTLTKSFVLHPECRDTFRRGVLVNLALSDLNRLVEMSNIIGQGMSLPVLFLGSLAIGCAIAGPEILITVLVAVAVALFVKKTGNQQGVAFRAKASCQGRRLSALNEMLQSIKLVKMYALEEHFAETMHLHRQDEERFLFRMKCALAKTFPAGVAMPAVSTILAVCLIKLVSGHLPNVPDTFGVVAVIRVLSLPFCFFGNFMGGIMMLVASSRRLQELLLQPEIVRPALGRLAGNPTSEESLAIAVTKHNFSWSLQPDTGGMTLQDITLKVVCGKFIAVVGELGSGKSSLLAALLGEMETTSRNSPEGASGSALTAASVCYVGQEPMIMNASIRENILFGSSWDKEKYDQALHAAALGPDLEILPSGDGTEVGERGVTLSGGQKVRVALARAVFGALGPAPVVALLDDPLSAVDAHVGAHIYQECILGAMAGCTRILVTNQLHFLAEGANEILVMEGGKIVERGTFANLSQKVTLAPTLPVADQAVGNASSMNSTEQSIQCPPAATGRFKQMLESMPTRAAKTPTQRSSTTTKRLSTASMATRVTVDENKREGNMMLQNLRCYLRALAWWPCVAILIASFWGYAVGEIGADIYLALWRQNTFGKDLPEVRMIGAWVLVASICMLLTLVARMSWAVFSTRGAHHFHGNMVDRLMHCPVGFFDRTPSGRIMNRFGEDQMNVDWTVALQVEVLLICIFKSINSLLLISGVAPWLLVGLAVLLPILALIREVHRRTAREAVRWWMLTKSPVFHSFEEMVGGYQTVAAFGREAFFKERFHSALWTNNCWLFTRDSANNWTELRLHMLGSLLVGTSALLIVAVGDGAPPAISAVSLIYGLLLTEQLRWVSYFAVQVESTLASVERVSEYTQDLEQEAAWHCATDGSLTAKHWPGDDPTIAFDGIRLRYAPNLPWVLHDFSAQCAPREKVGVVGRTGSGKSTLLSTLFRILEPESGRVLVNDVDIATVGLSLLRKRITAVPQDPLLFSGSLQQNLDPAGEHPEAEIWECLRRCGLADNIAKLEGGLEAIVSERGGNFSMGERQVFCIARALLRDTRVLCLDEATANVDPESDARMQLMLRTEFGQCCVLTIAHRLHTIIGNDRIMVLEQGRLVQFDTPAVLLSVPGQFQSLAQEAGLVGESSA